MNTANSTITTIGTIQACSCGATTSRPSTADSTEIAGVITPSPQNSEAPKMPRMPTTYVDREPLRSRSEEHTSELQSLMRTSYAVFCLQKQRHQQIQSHHPHVN